MIVPVVAAIAAIFTALFFVGLVLPPPDPIAQLKRQFRVLSRLSPAQADEALDERVQALTRRFPGRSYRWYLQWLVTDLQRAKR